MSQSVHQRLVVWLQERQARYQQLEHEPVFTSQQAAEVRGAPLSSGAKALICRCDEAAVHLVLPAHLKLDSNQARRVLGCRRLRFATVQEVLELTGLTPGSIPPFGSLFGLATWCDQRLGEAAEINFNAGDHAISIRMPFSEYLRVEQPQLAILGKA